MIPDLVLPSHRRPHSGPASEPWSDPLTSACRRWHARRGPSPGAGRSRPSRRHRPRVMPGHPRAFVPAW